MAFMSGTVGFSRFSVIGGSPKRLDDNLLDKIRQHLVGRQRVMRTDHEDVGWIGGRHVLDQVIEMEKNVVGDCLHFGLRIDTSRPPPDLTRAYVQMELDSLLGQDNRSGGFGRIKREATEAARRRIEGEVRDGKYRKLRHFPMLLDTRDEVVYVGATVPAVLERLYPLFKETFGKRLEAMSAGFVAFAWAEKKGVTRMLEGLQPARFVPDGRGSGHAEVYWTANDSTSRDYLGNEFLLWLWYTLAEESDTLKLADDTEASVVIVKHLVLECPRAETGKETIVCDGPAQLPESRRAIRSGKLPRKAGLIVSRQGEQYEFTLQAETFNISAGTLPKNEAMGNGNGHRNGHDLEEEESNGNGNGHANGNGNGFELAKNEERIAKIRHLTESVDLLFGAFLSQRLSPQWGKTLEAIQAWLRKG